MTATTAAPLPSDAVALDPDDLRFPLSSEDQEREFVLTGRELGQVRRSGAVMGFSFGVVAGGIAIAILGAIISEKGG